MKNDVARAAEETPRTYGVQAKLRQPLIDFMVGALEGAGCRILHRPSPDRAPFRITFETREGERLGIMAYAFRANTVLTKNRPTDEHRLQVKYGPEDEELHDVWQDPFGLYTTLFVGINPEGGFFVGADPWLHNPTRFYISIEFKQDHVDHLLRDGWHVWERKRRSVGEETGPVEVLVGGTAESFLRFVRFEREALREDQGHRQLLAEKFGLTSQTPSAAAGAPASIPPPSVTTGPSRERLHELATEFEMTENEVLDLIAGARRLKMAVRGWVAERHLVTFLKGVPGVTDCERSDAEGSTDVFLRFEGSRPLSIECKNVLRETNAAGQIRIDFQKTRASKGDPCSRYYAASDFNIVAACLHAVTERWEYRFAPSKELDPHGKCPGKLSHLVRLDDRWTQPVQEVLRAVVNR